MAGRLAEMGLEAHKSREASAKAESQLRAERAQGAFQSRELAEESRKHKERELQFEAEMLAELPKARPRELVELFRVPLSERLEIAVRTRVDLIRSNAGLAHWLSPSLWTETDTIKYLWTWNLIRQQATFVLGLVAIAGGVWVGLDAGVDAAHAGWIIDKLQPDPANLVQGQTLLVEYIKAAQLGPTAQYNFAYGLLLVGTFLIIATLWGAKPPDLPRLGPKPGPASES